MLLYLTKSVRPDITNAVCKLSKLLESPELREWKEMKHIIKYIFKTRFKSL